MNFKEAYKSTNNNLHADRSIIPELFAENKRKAAPNWKYVTLCSAAAVLLVVFGFSYFDDTDKNSDFLVVEQKVDTQKKSPGIPKAESYDNVTKEKENETVPKKASEEHNDHTAFSEVVPHNKSVVKENTDLTPAQADDSLMCDSADVGAPASGGGGGSMRKSSIRSKYLSIDEYERYLGVDFEAYNPALPYGMSFRIPEIVFTVDSNSGEITDDTVSFVATDAQNPSAILNVTISGQRTHNYYSVPGNLTNINGTDVVIFDENGVLRAELSYGDFYLVISSVDVSYEEFDTFLKSIL